MGSAYAAFEFRSSLVTSGTSTDVHSLKNIPFDVAIIKALDACKSSTNTRSGITADRPSQKGEVCSQVSYVFGGPE
jgi:uncharacterized protein YdaL